MRGYRTGHRQNAPNVGSIPADAGLPRCDQSARPKSQVYPRGCGATTRCTRSRGTGRGLSPRMRGYPPACPALRGRTGSIPADAGLPRPSPEKAGPSRVYPRGCGATGVVVSWLVVGWGLSPRMRGYRDNRGHNVCARRSIPADAGLPAVTGATKYEGRVYPRGCGATKGLMT